MTPPLPLLRLRNFLMFPYKGQGKDETNLTNLTTVISILVPIGTAFIF